MRIARAGWFGLVLSGVAAGQSVSAVPPPSPAQLTAATGRVIGSVTAADSNTPARMARVRLEPVPTASDSADSGGQGGRFGFQGGGGIAETQLDGTFELENVRPGAYFVIVEKAGYISRRAAFTEADLSDPSPSEQQLVGRALNRIQLEAGATARVDARLERGAAVSGAVQFDDGSPATGLQVSLLQKGTNGTFSDVRVGQMGFGLGQLTDDRGMYRLPSLPAGTYMLRATLAINDSRGIRRGGFGGGPGGQFGRGQVQFFGVGTAATRQADGATFTVGSAQELNGENMVLPLGRLHVVSGRISTSDGAHIVNSGSVALVFADDGSTVARTVIQNDDGEFRFPVVPDGKYVLKVTGAADIERDDSGGASGGRGGRGGGKTVASYSDAQLPVEITGERSDLVLSLQPKTDVASSGH